MNNLPKDDLPKNGLPKSAPVTSVLIVEDEESILLSLEFLLAKEGYAVTTARDGAAALRALQARPPDLALLDVMLPLIDGFELCRLIRENPALRGTRIMLVTARGREAEIARGMALGADAYLTKPFSTRELMDKVRALLGVPPPV
ncbi:MAG: response regulator [Burkholderiales bacterium]|jgi:DNA-binding response OmpR family regulator|nr:response regulator [Burkholderiales bacterium]